MRGNENYRYRCILEYSDEQGALKVLRRVLSLEISSYKNYKRAKVNLSSGRDKLVISIEAKDLVALQTTVTSLLKYFLIIFKTMQLVEGK